MAETLKAPHFPPFEVQLGTQTVRLVPNYIDGCGPRVLLMTEGPLNLTAEDAKHLAGQIKIAATEAEILEKRSKH